MPATFRPIEPGDFAEVCAVNQRIEAQDALPYVTTLESFEEWRKDPNLDLALDTRLVAVDGQVVGWGRLWFRPSGEREERVYLLGGIDAAHRGRGFGGELLAWQRARAAAILNALGPALPHFVRAQAHESRHTAQRLYARHGLSIVRYIDELLRDLSDRPASASPAGLRIVPWDSARSEQARLAQNEAFADHWGSTPRDGAAWEYELAEHGSRPDLSFLALDGERVVGVCRNGCFPDDEVITGRREGWVTNVSVVRSHRRRGLASALVLASLEAFTRAGLTHAALAVDSENVTGAYGIYERLGFRKMHRNVVWQEQVGAPLGQ